MFRGELAFYRSDLTFSTRLNSSERIALHHRVGPPYIDTSSWSSLDHLLSSHTYSTKRGLPLAFTMAPLQYKLTLQCMYSPWPVFPNVRRNGHCGSATSYLSLSSFRSLSMSYSDYFSTFSHDTLRYRSW